VPAFVVAITLPGLAATIRYADTKPFAYRESDLYRDAQSVDTWLGEHHWEDRRIYTLCYQLLPFSHVFFIQIRRLALSTDSEKLWNTPANLLPVIRQENRLFMTCDEKIFDADWKSYLGHPDSTGIPERFSEVGRVGKYTFYEVVHIP